MRLLLDEMHASAIADALREDAWDVLAVGAESALRGLPDEELLAHASAVERALVTENVGDFASIAARWAGEGRPHAGLIYTHPRRFNRAALAYPGNLIAALRRFLAESPTRGQSWTWWL